MQIPLKEPVQPAAEPSKLNAVERTEKMLEVVRNHDQNGIVEVLKLIGEAEETRGERMKEYVNAAKDFLKDLTP